MKGVVLAGGRGTRLKSLTRSVNKHLLPVYDKPLIYWPVMTLVRMGIEDIMIVSNAEDVERYRALFEEGENLGASITYGVQDEPNGVAGALRVAEHFASGESVAVILGDNIFIDSAELRDALAVFQARGEQGALVFLKQVDDPERFGVAEVAGTVVVSIEEKPTHPRSNLAVTGLYLYESSVFSVARTLAPSKRGELEISDVNQAYLDRGLLTHHRIEGTWIDAGTHESLLEANLVAAGMGYDMSPKVKVLFGVNKLSVGGAEHLVLHQLARINRKRFDAHLATLLASTAPNLDKEAEHLGSRWEKFSFRGFFDLFAFVQLYQYLRRERFDVVITSLYFTNILLRAAAILARVPVVLSCEVNVKRERGERLFLLEKLLARYTDRFIVNSKEVLEIYMERMQLPREKFALIYSAVDLEAGELGETSLREELCRRYGLQANDTVIVTAGRLVEQKGHRYLIEAMDTLRRTLPHVSLKFICFGEGELRNKLLEEVRRLGLGKDIFLPGIAPVKDILATADIFVLPSLWEGMSLMLLEAMAAGKPIVATDISGSRELIADKVNGFVVPPGNAAALAQSIKTLIEQPTLRDAFGKASRREVQKFSIEHNLNNLYMVINSILQQKKV